jgi:hypothetical protein
MILVEVNWGDGTTEVVEVTPNVPYVLPTHTYTVGSPTDYTISVRVLGGFVRDLSLDATNSGSAAVRSANLTESANLESLLLKSAGLEQVLLGFAAKRSLRALTLAESTQALQVDSGVGGKIDLSGLPADANINIKNNSAVTEIVAPDTYASGDFAGNALSESNVKEIVEAAGTNTTKPVSLKLNGQMPLAAVRASQNGLQRMIFALKTIIADIAIGTADLNVSGLNTNFTVTTDTTGTAGSIVLQSNVGGTTTPVIIGSNKTTTLTYGSPGAKQAALIIKAFDNSSPTNFISKFVFNKNSPNAAAVNAFDFAGAFNLSDLNLITDAISINLAKMTNPAGTILINPLLNQSSLSKATLAATGVSSLDLSNLSNLLEIVLSDLSALTALNITGSSIVNKLSITAALLLTTITGLSAADLLEELTLDNTGFTALTISPTIAGLKSAIVKNNSGLLTFIADGLAELINLDLRSNPNVATTRVRNNPQLVSAPLLTGSVKANSTFDLVNNNFGTSDLTDILSDLANANVNNGTLNLTGQLSGAGFPPTNPDYVTLVSRSWIPSVDLDTFSATLVVNDPTFTFSMTLAINSFIVDWGDASDPETFTAPSLTASHLYATGTYTIKVTNTNGINATVVNITNPGGSSSNNYLTAFDAQYLTFLTNLTCPGNRITTLNLANCLALAYLDCSDNRLEALDVSANTALATLLVNNNNNASFTALNVSGKIALTQLNCSNTGSLTSVTASGCTNLTNLSVLNRTTLGTLNLSGCTSLLSFNYGTTSGSIGVLTSLNVSLCSSLVTLNAQYNTLNSLTLTGCTSLATLAVQNNSLAALSLTGLVALQTLTCNNNSLITLSLAGLVALQSLTCSSNPSLNTIVFNNGPVPNLTSIRASDSVLTTLTNFSATNLPAISTIFLNNNSLATLSVANMINLTDLNCSFNLLTNVIVTGITNIANFFANNNSIALATNINNILIAIDGFGKSGPGKSLTLNGGTNAVPTGLGATAATSLRNRNWTVTTAP